jgi:cytoskeletal protein CcmA (bactofilin family)
VSSGCTRLTNEDVGELYGRAQDEIRRLAGNGNALHPEAASSISSGLSIVGKIIGHGALTIFGRVEGEVRASIVVVAEGAEMVGEVVAEELTVGGQLKGTIHANRVRLNGTGVVEGDIFHRTLAIEENARAPPRGAWCRRSQRSRSFWGCEENRYVARINAYPGQELRFGD